MKKSLLACFGKKRFTYLFNKSFDFVEIQHLACLVNTVNTYQMQPETKEMNQNSINSHGVSLRSMFF